MKRRLTFLSALSAEKDAGRSGTATRVLSEALEDPSSARNNAPGTPRDLAGETRVDIGASGFLSVVQVCCRDLTYMPKLGRQTAARQSSARSFTVFATVIGE